MLDFQLQAFGVINAATLASEDFNIATLASGTSKKSGCSSIWSF